MNGNDLGNYEDVRTLVDSAVNSALIKVTDMERKMKILEILAEVSDILIRKIFLCIYFYDDITTDELYGDHC